MIKSYSIYETSKLKDDQLKTFINILISQLNNTVKNKRKAIENIHMLLSLIKSAKFDEIDSATPKPISYLNKFIKEAAWRFALREYSARGKKTLLPKPVSKEKARLRFLKTTLLALQNRRESDWSKKLIAEIEDFYNKRGSAYNSKIEAYAIAKHNLRQGRYVYKRSKLKSNLNAVKKDKLTYL